MNYGYTAHALKCTGSHFPPSRDTAWPYTHWEQNHPQLPAPGTLHSQGMEPRSLGRAVLSMLMCNALPLGALLLPGDASAQAAFRLDGMFQRKEHHLKPCSTCGHPYFCSKLIFTERDNYSQCHLKTYTWRYRAISNNHVRVRRGCIPAKETTENMRAALPWVSSVSLSSCSQFLFPLKHLNVRCWKIPYKNKALFII